MNATAEEIVRILRLHGKKISVAESCTGGLLSAALTNVPGASSVFRGGAITYATETKTEMLGVPAALISRFGVVSAECAEAMAEGVAKKFRTDFALSTTGFAGPGGGEPGTPVGTVFIGMKSPAGTFSTRFQAAPGTTRDTVRREAVATAFSYALEKLGTGNW